MSEHKAQSKEALKNAITSIPLHIEGKSTARLTWGLQELFALLDDPCSNLVDQWFYQIIGRQVEPSITVEEKREQLIEALQIENIILSLHFSIYWNVLISLLGVETNPGINSNGCNDRELVNQLSRWVYLKANIEFVQYWAKQPPPLIPEQLLAIAFIAGATLAIGSILLGGVAVLTGVVTIGAVADGLGTLSTIFSFVGAAGEAYNGTFMLLDGNLEDAVYDYVIAAFNFSLLALNEIVFNMLGVNEVEYVIGQGTRDTFLTQFAHYAADTITNFLTIETTGPVPPTSASDYYNQGLAQYNSGLYEDAITSFSTALALGYQPSTNILDMRGQAFALVGNYSAAAYDFESYLSSDPRNLGITDRLSRIYCGGLHDRNRAIEVYQRFLDNIDRNLPGISMVVNDVQMKIASLTLACS